MKAWTLRALLLLSLTGSAWAQTPEAPAPSALRVTYLVYSGRPNPTITITDAKTIRSLQSQLSGALVTGAGVRSTELPSVLGYNGIRVEAVDPAGTDVEYTVKGRFLRSENRKASAQAKASAVTATASTSASQIEAQLLKLAENRGVLSTSALATARKSAGK
ncbi:hypothetical protein ASD53_05635 [Lysobacter sp. Root559]|uniref:hypothetical protein n=1 Tax=Lysobacter sp. Root559 TaxID=1736559 RepID=UPI0006F9B90F|nr:hypothetical protein [Lysobacter sp. Root559]KQZ59687.1 hypothetical protein ASD53_05635 [Lysobacter sp. Root559]